MNDWEEIVKKMIQEHERRAHVLETDGAGKVVYSIGHIAEKLKRQQAEDSVKLLTQQVKNLQVDRDWLWKFSGQVELVREATDPLGVASALNVLYALDEAYSRKDED